MIITKQGWLKRSLSLLLAMIMCISMISVAAFAEGSNSTTAIEDGVYRVPVKLLKANAEDTSSTDSLSMGNSAVRGATGTDDYKPLLIVEDGKAALIMEYIPMSFLGTYGFLLELNTLSDITLNAYGYPGNYTLTPAEALAEHRMTDGSPAYDSYNNPDSKYVLSYASGKAYPRVLSIPIELPYTAITALENTQWVQVYVPVMASIQAESGKQLARLLLDYENMTAVEDLSEEVEYWLYKAVHTEKGEASEEDWAALQQVIAETKTKLSNTIEAISESGARTLKEMNESERATQVTAIRTAMSAVNSNEEIVAYRQKAISAIIAYAEKVKNEISLSEDTQADITEIVSAAKKSINEAVSIAVIDKVASETYGGVYFDIAMAAVNYKCNEVENFCEQYTHLLEENEFYNERLPFTQESWENLYKYYALVYIRLSYGGYASKTAAYVLQDATNLNQYMNEVTYKAADYTAVDEAISGIPGELSAYTVETVNAVNDAVNAVVRGKNITEQAEVDAMAKAIEDAVAALEKKLDFSALQEKQNDAKAIIEKYSDVLNDNEFYNDGLPYTQESWELMYKTSLAVEIKLMFNGFRSQEEIDDYTDQLTQSIAALTYKGADYTAVDAALEKIPADLSIYTDETAKAVTDAKNAVVWNKTIAEQAEVDAMAKAIEDAVAALEKKLDFSALQEKQNDAKAIIEKYSDVLNDNEFYNDGLPYTQESWELMYKTSLAVEIKLMFNGFRSQEEIDDYTDQLTQSIAALTYKGADYTAVDAALEKIPADLSVYTDETAKAVTDAKNAVNRDKNITEQASVDAMAKAIEDAVAGLEQRSYIPDNRNLEDGVYYLYGEMIKVNRTEKSMSNDAINHAIKLTVEDGKYSLTIDFNGLSYLNKFGYLANLSYYDSGYTYGKYGKIEGTAIPVEILTTQKNADGTDVIDEFNQPGGSCDGILYPNHIKFLLVSDALADSDGYVPLHVFVPVMEAISVGSGDQDVLLRLDWSTLKKTTEDDPVFAPDDPVEQSPAVDYIDMATGVAVHADKGVLEEGVQIVVTEITKGSDYDNASVALSDVGKKFKLYGVNFYDADGKEVVPNGTVSISFPVTAGYDSANLAVYRVNTDGSKTLVKGVVENSYYTVITKTAGKYALVEKDSTITDNQNTNDINNGSNDSEKNSPKTGDNTNLTVWFLLLLVCSGLLVVLIVTKKRRTIKGV